ncbi:MAG: hypothetical protein LBV32_03735 [Tannerellaceae bacterium]|jgi:hypothetical protein|nr:hypothetical protein [Tannerellaceae bacterium]
MSVNKTKLYKYSPLWYAVMAMKAFSNGDYTLTDHYFERGQHILDNTGSLFLPMQPMEEAESFSISNCNVGE